MHSGRSYVGLSFAAIGVLTLTAVGYAYSPSINEVDYQSNPTAAQTIATNEEQPQAPTSETAPLVGGEPAITITHIPTPAAVKAIYMSQCVVGTPSFRSKLVALIDETELNGVVIDIKDYSGRLSFIPDDPALRDWVSPKCRASDMRAFIDTLHKKNIYVIGRITVFQDPYYTKIHPELAVQSATHTSPWVDHKGLSFIQVGAKAYWDDVIKLTKESYAAGFDEINFDYIRFPSDGDMKDAVYTLSEGKVKAAVLKEFFEYLHSALADTGITTSADLFGMTATNKDDLNIGQVLENTLPYFDFYDPMVYPSHYPPTWNGFKNPAKYPYEVVDISMKKAVARAKASGEDISKIRPWLQDFDLGAKYTGDMVRAQIKATYDNGLDSWLMWDAGNTYTKEAFLNDADADALAAKYAKEREEKAKTEAEAKAAAEKEAAEQASLVDQSKTAVQ